MDPPWAPLFDADKLPRSMLALGVNVGFNMVGGHDTVLSPARLLRPPLSKHGLPLSKVRFDLVKLGLGMACMKSAPPLRRSAAVRRCWRAAAVEEDGGPVTRLGAWLLGLDLTGSMKPLLGPENRLGF